MKILVVGSNGQVGFELCRLGADSHHEVVCVDRSTVDICVPSQVRDVLSAQRPDIVINAAGYTAVDKAEKEGNAAFAANEKGPESMAQVCDEIGAAFLHISTDYVSKNKNDQIQREFNNNQKKKQTRVIKDDATKIVRVR